MYRGWSLLYSLWMSPCGSYRCDCLLPEHMMGVILPPHLRSSCNLPNLIPCRSRYGHREKMTDLVAVWEVALSDGVHKIEFEHGTTSGKRVVYVDGKEIIRKDWMFKLVGKETFLVGASQAKATINIDAVSGFAYEYTLEVNGKSLKKYMENRSKTTNTWVLHVDGEDCRVVLGK
ncbi:hypothetical protein GDO81_027700, partial [Engystomops pustulosus]